MPNRHRTYREAISNRAQLAETGEIREARELWALGYTKLGWVCVDENCRVRMDPIAWERPNDDGRFCHKGGAPFERPPHFRAEPDHKPGCKASHPNGPSDRPAPQYHIGPPTDYPHRVILFRTQNLNRTPDKRDGAEQDEEDAERQHARWIRSISEACEYYVDHPDEHWRPLRVDRCPGKNYRECFVRFGTGDRQGIGRNWIFYDEIRFRDWVTVEAEPIRITLLGSIYRNPRTLVIHTATWPTEHRKHFRKRLKAALAAGWVAYKEGRPERPWIFAFANERTFDELEVQVTLQPGVEVLVRAMPQLKWQYRPTHRFAMPRRPAPNIQPEPLPVDAVAPSPESRTEMDAAATSEPPVAEIVEEVAQAKQSVPETDSDCLRAGQVDEDLVEPGCEEAKVSQNDQPADDMPLADDVVISDVLEPTVDEPLPAPPKVRDPKEAIEEESSSTSEIVGPITVDRIGNDQELAATRWNGISQPVRHLPDTPKPIGKIRWFISRMKRWRAT